MRAQGTPSAKLTTVAVFPQNSFLENLAVRADGSILVTEILQKQLWYVPPAAAVPAEPVPWPMTSASTRTPTSPT